MKMISPYILLVLFLISTIAWAPAGRLKQVSRWSVSSSSSLLVKGNTNMDKFNCEISSYDKLDTLKVTEKRDSVTLSGKLQLNLRGFDCHHPEVTRDLHETLKTQQFPVLSITFLSLSRIPAFSQQPAHITGWVNIELAGTCKRVEVEYQLSVDSQNIIHLTGFREVTFSDFNLTPPTKFKGMGQTHQKLIIQFHLKLQAIV